MMHCLHCGGCCLLMSPKSAPFRCPDLIQKEGYYFCRCYKQRPQICQDFWFEEFLFCPYGLNKLRLSYPEDKEKLWERKEKGACLINELRQTAISHKL